MHPRKGGDEDGRRQATVRRRELLAAGGVVAAAGLGGCLSRVASAVTNTAATPAAAFAGARSESFTLSEPHVARLTPRLTAGARGLSGEVELEGWVTATAVAAANYNNTRSNRSGIAGPDSVVTDGELDDIHRYLAGEAIVAERFTACVPDAAVPGGDESIAAAVTPRRLLDYVTGRSEGSGRVYSWGDDCDDTDEGASPGVCGRTGHLAAAVSGPVATGGRLDVVRAEDGTVVVSSTSGGDGGPPVVRVDAEGGSDGPESSTEAIYQAWGGPSDGGGGGPEIPETLVAQVLVQPPGCPHPFPALLYVGRGESDGQLLYSGGWVVDDAALYEDSATVLTRVDTAPVVGIGIGDLDGDGLEDGIETALRGNGRGRRVVAGRSRRGARLDAGPVDGLVEEGVLTEGARQGYDSVRRKQPGGRGSEDGGEPRVTHLALDAPVLHLVDAGEASNEVKFKAGAELSKAVS